VSGCAGLPGTPGSRHSARTSNIISIERKCAIIKKTNSGKHSRKRGPLNSVGGNVNYSSHYESSSKN
jgi:hypothetical protein